MVRRLNLRAVAANVAASTAIGGYAAGAEEGHDQIALVHRGIGVLPSRAGRDGAMPTRLAVAWGWDGA